MSLQQIESSMRNCTSCKEILSKYEVIPRPIFFGSKESLIMLIGQAPGITEYKTGKPFQGSAGKSIINLFKNCGIEDFNSIVYQTSVTKCFPGRALNTSVDRKPSNTEVINCLPFLSQQISIIKPKIIVCLGMLAWKALIVMKEKESEGFCESTYSKSALKLTTSDIVGKRFLYKNIPVIAMIHPSGAANGARAKNKEQHEESIEIFTKEINEVIL